MADAEPPSVGGAAPPATPVGPESGPPAATGAGGHVHAEGEVQLAREITLVDATMMGVGALMGGGVFVLLGLGTAISGPAILLALFLNGLVTIPTLMVYAELGSASHDAGGGYLWVKQGLGKALGFLGGWLGWFSHVIACSLYSIASASFILTILHVADPTLLSHDAWATPLLPAFSLGSWSFGGYHIGVVQYGALAIGALFVLLNYVGVKIGIKAENVVNTIVLVTVLAFVAFGMWKVWQNPALVRDNLSPFFRFGGTGRDLSSIFLAMGVTFVAFEGYEIISQTSEEMQNPKRNIPRAMWYSFLIAWALMLVVAFIALGVTQAPDGGQSYLYLGSLGENALITMADQVMGYGTIIIAASALLLQMTALNATLYSSSRVSFAMGRDGNLPRAFGKVHRKRRTPHNAVIASGILVLAIALFPLADVATAAAVMFLLLFLFVNTSYIKLRKIIPPERFGFRAPLFPYLPLIAIFSQLFLAVYLWKFSPTAWYIAIAWLGLGILFYYTYVARRETAPVPPIVPLSAPLPMAPARARKDYRILVLFSSPAPSTARSLAKFAGSIAQAVDGEVILLQPVIVPELTPLSEGQAFYKDRSLLQQARAAVPPGVEATTMVRIGHNLDAMVREAVADEKASLLLMSGQARPTVGQPTSPLLAFPPCDVAMLRLKNPDITGRQVLVTTSHNVHTKLGIHLGSAIAKVSGGKVLLYQAAKDAEELPQLQEWARSDLESAVLPGVEASAEAEQGETIRKVLDKSRGADLVVVGGKTSRRIWAKGLLGQKTQEITDRVAGNVLIVRSAADAGKGNNWVGRMLIQLRRYVQPE